MKNINYKLKRYIIRLKHHLQRWGDRMDRLNDRYPIIPKTVRVLLWTVTVVFVLVASLVLFIYAGAYGRMPSKADIKAIENDVASEVYAQDGTVLGKYFIEHRTSIEYEDISPNIIKALVATEDVRFYKHRGIDYQGLFRVLFKTIIGQDESSGGGSTITQQLAKNLYPRKGDGFLYLTINKVQEMIIAHRLEKVYSKKEILTLYLNTISFGENIYGIEAATNRFFSTPPSETTLEEAAVLIGMLKATTFYNPRFYPINSRYRRDVVIGQMEKYDVISSALADSLKSMQVNLNYSATSHTEGKAMYFREYLRDQLDTWAASQVKSDGSTYNLYRDGLKIYTTIDHKMQVAAEEAVQEHMEQLQNTFEQHWNNKKPWDKDKHILTNALHRTERYRVLKAQGLSEKEIEIQMREPVPMTIYKHNGEVAKILSPMDSLKHYEMFLNGGFFAMEPSTGYVKAWVGGIDYKFFQYDNVTAKRQVGSTFKPIVYATALEQGLDPCDHIPNYRKVYREYDNWSPRNADKKYGGNYSMQKALINSVNVVSVRLIMNAGINHVINNAREMGITAEIPPYPSIALGAADISLYEMVAAYTTFANRGYYNEPRVLLRIEDRYGNVLKDFRGEGKTRKVFSQETADLMVHLLQQVVDEGTGRRLRFVYNFENDIAGKTGTTQSHADGWFIGFTPELVGGARVGANNPEIHFRTLQLGQGSNMALPIWGIFMKKIQEDSTYHYIFDKEFPELTEELEEKLDCPGVIYYSREDDEDPASRPFWKYYWDKKEGENGNDNRENNNNNNGSEGIDKKIKDLFSTNKY